MMSVMTKTKNEVKTPPRRGGFPKGAALVRRTREVFRTELRLTREIAERLDAAARKEGTTLSRYVERLLEEHLPPAPAKEEGAPSEEGGGVSTASAA